MRFRDRPLLPSSVDAELYLQRPRLEWRVLTPLLEGRNVLLLGEAGSGKTTLLRYVAGQLDLDGRQHVMVNAGLAGDVEGLLALVDSELDPEAGDAGRVDPSGRGGSGSLLAAVRRLRRAEPVTILVDGLLDPNVAYDLFGRLRDELWELGHSWLVTARARDSAPLRTPPADAFWAAIVEIAPLSAGEAEALLGLGLNDDERWMVDVAAGRVTVDAHPRTVIRAAQAALAAGDAGTSSAPNFDELRRRALKLGRSEALAMRELIGMDRPVSVQDPELLQRLGWSRPYAQRVFSKLEDEGLLRSIPERGTDRPGRPRKLYEPSSDQWA